ncbi:MAG: uroporphyrinogen-III synthase [Reyranellaceae bacterium]
MSRRVLIGRSLAQAGPLVEQVARLGVVGVYQALLQVEKFPAPADFEARLGQAQAIVVTSANAVARLGEYTRKRFVPVLAVGDGTARAARSLGFADVASAQGDAAALLQLCRKHLRPAEGSVLYLRGRDVAQDLAPALAADGYEIDPMVVYATEPVRQFRPPVERALKQANLDAAVLFSPRGAANFVSLVRQAGVEYACAGMTLIAFSPAVAQAAADDMVWRLRLVAEKPTMPALLATLEQWRDGKFAG